MYIWITSLAWVVFSPLSSRDDKLNILELVLDLSKCFDYLRWMYVGCKKIKF